MKILSIILVAISLSSTAAAQRVIISYDENGNRTRREIVTPRPSGSGEPGTGMALTTETGGAAANALQSLRAGAFSVYPNPSADVFNAALDATLLKDKCELVLIDQLGKEHFRTVARQAITPISTGHLVDGVYYLVLYRNGKKEVVKLVKQAGMNGANRH